MINDQRSDQQEEKKYQKEKKKEKRKKKKLGGIVYHSIQRWRPKQIPNTSLNKRKLGWKSRNLRWRRVDSVEIQSPLWHQIMNLFGFSGIRAVEVGITLKDIIGHKTKHPTRNRSIILQEIIVRSKTKPTGAYRFAPLLLLLLSPWAAKRVRAFTRWRTIGRSTEKKHGRTPLCSGFYQWESRRISSLRGVN